MTQNNYQSVQEVIDKVVAYAEKQLPKSEVALVSAFIRLYYSNIALEDIQDRSISDLFGAVYSHWELIETRKPKELKVEVFNPDPKKDGWQSPHTVVQVISDDMPFLVDSIRTELNRLGYTIHLMIHMGGVKVCRDSKHQIDNIFSYHTQHDRKSTIEAPIAMEIDRQTDPKVLADIQRDIRRVLKDVRAAVEDWHLMVGQVQEIIRELSAKKTIQNPAEVKETQAFLEWLLADHFTFLGSRDYEVVGIGKDRALKLIPDSGFGVLRDHTHSKMLRQYAEMPKEARERALSKHNLLILGKTNTVSTVHRPTYTDYIGVKRFNEKGELIGERRFIGLYTSDVYRSDPRLVPILRNKVAEIRQRSGLPDKSHAGKDLMHILATLPRDDLFHASASELYDWSMGILHLQERRRIRFFYRKDPYNRFISCLVYVPRENFTTTLVMRMRDLLMQTFHGLDITFTTYFSDSILARIHFMVRIDPQKEESYDIPVLEKKLMEIGASWEDGFRECVLEHYGEAKGRMIFNQYKGAFPTSYRETFTPHQALLDVEHIEKISETHSLGMRFYKPTDVPSNVIRFKLYHYKVTVPLSDALPMLENMGLRIIGEQSYRITLNDGKVVWINDFNMTYVKEPTFNVDEVRSIFQEAFEKTWFGQTESDYFNRLVLEAELNWREIALFRAYTKYLKQIGFTFSDRYISETFVKNPAVSKLLINLFKSHFDPARVREVKQKSEEIEQEIHKELDKIAVLDEDRILRRYLTLIHATLRTTYFQLDENNQPKTYLAFKLDPTKITEMPLPLPQYEIFVYSPRFEGVHLRAAKVARGGIRWSDRREDYRTEILGLMKAQQVKNAVIVPAGAKGGFVLKRSLIDMNRDEIFREGVACYQGFINGLLDLTDNLVGKEIVTPANTVCYDGNDPYLVVAADKGTSSFSDIANSIALEKKYWLGDAFASGGSTGYDHKKMGITAKGAWISAKRHFQELGVNIDEAEITVVGIGDMSGDVFGNGMLLSKHIKLVAAFNGQNIFLDPNPVPETSYQERLRLFNLPRSTWEDYNHALLSPGGGIYSRSAKAIPLSPEVQALLGVKKDVLIPTELIRAILKAPIDMIWNGGIGTYIKASTENNNEVGDRSNDSLRVNGKDLQARIVCEGGNLGVTQLGRIEYALNGGKINTDFIDNSAGVDCSDHEVNIKILLNNVMAHHSMTEKQRNNLLASMADEVSRLVLEDNYHQNKAVSQAASKAVEDLTLYEQYMNSLEKAEKLDRNLEFLPDTKAIMERRAAGQALTRPELCVLLSYSKIVLKAQIKKSALVRDPYLLEFIEDAFPKPLRRYKQQMEEHYLAKEIIATQLTNRLVAEMGITFAYQMEDETATSISAVVRSYAAASGTFELKRLLGDIETLDYKVPAALQYKMNEEVIRLVRRSARWFLRNRRSKLDISATIEHFSPHVNAIYRRLPKLLLGADKEAMENKQRDLIKEGVPEEIALKVACAGSIFHSLNIVEAATTYKEEVFRVAKTYFMVADQLDLFWLRERINLFPIDTRWGILARTSYKGDLDWIQRELTVRVLLDTEARSIPGKIKEWLTKHETQIQRWKTILTQMRSADMKDFAILFVAIRELLDLASAH